MTRGRAITRLLLAPAVALAAAGCAPLTLEEAELALVEAKLAAEVEAVAVGTAERATRFGAGTTVDEAAAELGASLAGELSCAAVTVTGATVAVDYGAPGGSCSLHGESYAGRHEATIVANGADEVVVDHAFDGLTNGRVAVSGSARTRSRAGDASRSMTHALEWTRLDDGRAASGSGEVVLRPLEGGFDEGYAADGERSFTGESGAWTLAAVGAETRWAARLPDAGRYEVDAPFGKRVTLTFRRASPVAIAAVAASGPRSYHFEITTAPREP